MTNRMTRAEIEHFTHAHVGDLGRKIITQLLADLDAAQAANASESVQAAAIQPDPRIAALVEALAPFAWIAEMIDTDCGGFSSTDDFGLWLHGQDGPAWLAGMFTLADFAKARAALAALESQP